MLSSSYCSSTFSAPFVNSGYFTQYKDYIKANLLFSSKRSSSFILSGYSRVFNYRKLYTKKKKFRKRLKVYLYKRKLNDLFFYNVSKPLTKAAKKFLRSACQNKEDHTFIKPNLRRLYPQLANNFYSTTCINTSLLLFNNKSDAKFNTSLLEVPSLSLLSNVVSANRKLHLDSIEGVTNIIPDKLFFNPTYFNFKPILSRDINFYPDVAP